VRSPDRDLPDLNGELTSLITLPILIMGVDLAPGANGGERLGNSGKSGCGEDGNDSDVSMQMHGALHEWRDRSEVFLSCRLTGDVC